ncbi:acyl-CoA dehydrogenase NM domain-like protein [Aspergillus alliaceus]|uniref:acyl-CoA dehydrogenase NM domain-like protein n=1 Tax=Petromyces alliaceus TaxID=209559 RepID=UPI0012A5B895|nr:acyl-CoA dehydrogenase NM domain-like protein [Aspergillus alliaceus]KAB8238254.1 acyl-CoA dehydrogenase NM domain-like protein [Aspergillus alliaceus]
MSSVFHLLESHLFTLPWNSMSEAEQLKISYDRSRAIGRAFQFTMSDILHLTPKFWKFHRENICALDICASSLVTIQCNLVAGTLAPFVQDHPEHRLLLDQILNFDVNAQFLLTELGHGLDAKNLETTATLLEDGGFDLHTPHINAAKYMSPTSPVPGHPRIGLVIARLMVADEDRGVRPFIVRINDGESMSPGIICKVLPRRAGSKMVDHSTTTFNHVHLPKTSLLGSLKKPLNERDQFLSVISRISVGTLAISTTMIPILKRCAFVAGKYSLRRQIKGPSGSQIPIISFRTQQGPILHALANIAVFEAWATDCTQRFCDMNLETRVRHGIATAFKAVLTRATQDTLYTLAERCGAQGLYEHNHIIESQLESRGISIAEGDTLTLCIRLASELLLGRYKLPPPNYPECLLAQHETSLFDECRAVLQNLSTGHRSQEFNHAILPKCQLLVESAGQRMAYEAALSASVPSELLAIYEAGSIRQDPAWYVEKCGITHEKLFAMECQALDAGLLSFDQLLDELDVEPYCTAPILSETLMEDFNARLRTYENKGEAKHSKDSIPQSRL